MFKEYTLDAILANLTFSEYGAVLRSSPDQVRAGAGVAANLVDRGIAHWYNGWNVKFTELGVALNRWATQ